MANRPPPDQEIEEDKNRHRTKNLADTHSYFFGYDASSQDQASTAEHALKRDHANRVLGKAGFLALGGFAATLKGDEHGIAFDSAGSMRIHRNKKAVEFWGPAAKTDENILVEMYLLHKDTRKFGGVHIKGKDQMFNMKAWAAAKAMGFPDNKITGDYKPKGTAAERAMIEKFIRMREALDNDPYKEATADKNTTSGYNDGPPGRPGTPTGRISNGPPPTP